MKKWKFKKSYFDTFKVDLRGIWNNFFSCTNSKSKIVASVGGAYASKDKMVRIWPTFLKNLFFISALKSPTYRDFMP